MFRVIGENNIHCIVHNDIVVHGDFWVTTLFGQIQFNRFAGFCESPWCNRCSLFDGFGDGARI